MDAIICYDIADPKRLQRLHRYLLKQAVPIQYSVFLFAGDERRLRACLEEAARHIDPREDDLRAYPLPQRGLKARVGCPVLPEGILWGALPGLWYDTTVSQPPERDNSAMPAKVPDHALQGNEFSRFLHG
jgi:CRISPR-associated endonuclease Cas2